MADPKSRPRQLEELEVDTKVDGPEYPIGVPSKFDPSGKVQPFPGNTIICHLCPSSELYASLLILYEKLKFSPLSSLYTLLPPESWHMTVFEGVCDKVRGPGYWPSDLAPDASLADCNALFESKLRSFDLQCDPPYLVAATGIDPLEVGIGVTVKLRGAAEERRLRGLRDRLADVLQIRHPQHDTYGLHLSMAYLLRHLTEDQSAELTRLLMAHLHAEGLPVSFELGAPEFCTFDDMFAFRRVMYLENH